MNDVLRCVLFLVGMVTITEIVVIQWLLRRHRLYDGQHVLLAESSLLVVASTVVLFVLRWPHGSEPGKNAR